MHSLTLKEDSLGKALYENQSQDEDFEKLLLGANESVIHGKKNNPLSVDWAKVLEDLRRRVIESLGLCRHRVPVGSWGSLNDSNLRLWRRRRNRGHATSIHNRAVVESPSLVSRLDFLELLLLL